MGSHPANLVLRFLLEIIALIFLGIWGWHQSETWFRFVLAIGIPVVLAIIWGTFAVPGDPSRSGSAPVVIAGLIRLIIEFGAFGFTIWSLIDMEWSTISWILGILVLVHYMASYDRIVWLLTNQPLKNQ